MCSSSEDFLHYDYVRLAWDIGFNFEDVDSQHAFDLNVIGLVDVDKVAKDRDIPTVVKHIPTLLKFRLEDEIGKVLEPNFIKVFKLSQLSIQYLKFCKKYLDNTVALLKNELATLQEEKDELEMYLEEVRCDYELLQRKYHELQATLSTNTYKCEDCAKTFYSEEYLLAHIKRRHNQESQTQQVQSESDKLQLEIKELKQRLNNTEKLIKHEKESEKEKEHIEPNNDAAVFEDSIQFKFEQLKNHIEAEINSLKDEDFYRGICEKFIKERVERKLSVHTVQVPSNTVLDLVADSKEMKLDVVEIDKSTKESAKVIATESSTQTDSTGVCVNTGTSTSPQPTPRKNVPHEDGDHQSIDGSMAKTSEVSIKTIEAKLAREVELQRDTLEQILDLKLSGSLNKMEAQMNAFWDKLNAWESTITRPVLVTKSTSDQNITKTDAAVEPKASTRINLQKPNSTGSIVLIPEKTDHQTKPKALPRHFSPKTERNARAPTQVTSIRVSAKSTLPVTQKSEPARLLVSESSEEETETSEQSKTEEQTSTCTEERPSNIKASASFRKRLDETLLQRLKSQQHGGIVTAPPQIVNTAKSTTTINYTKELHQGLAQSQNEKKIEDQDADLSSIISTSPQNETQSNFSDTSIRQCQAMRKRLKRHVVESVNQKLKDIGVSPHWKGLPEKSYNKAIEIVEHQANLSKKNILDFHKIRKNIERAIDKEIENAKHEDHQPVKQSHTNSKGLNKLIKEETLESLEPTPPQTTNSQKSINNSEIPLHRVTGRQILKPKTTFKKHLSPQSSFSSKSSPIARTQSNQRNKKLPTVQKVDVNVHNHNNVMPTSSLEVTPASTSTPATNFILPSAITTITGITTTAVSEVSTANKKKVLFNLDSDSDQAPVHLPLSPTKTNLSTYVKLEKSKLEDQLKTSNKTAKLGNHIGSASESSDWDISDIT